MNEVPSHNMKKCKNCDNDAAITGAPKTILQFTIPFTQIEIIVWNWNSKDYSDYCMDCLVDKEHDKIRDYTDAAHEDGYADGYKQGFLDSH